VVDRQTLLRQLKEVGSAGYAVDDGEYIEEVMSIAVPVRDHTRSLVGSLTISGPVHRLTPERVEKEIVPLITNGGKQLSSRLGYRQ
jgi:DNA-binding IclR family transcriptional regulator